MTPGLRVPRTAYLLGYAGLLPQIAAVALIMLGRSDPTNLAHLTLAAGYVMATVYAAAILSFLGGIWWGFAMRRSVGQARLAAIAVLPSLTAAALAVCAARFAYSPWPLVALGVALLLTLPVDQNLNVTGETPEGWMRLRLPLSLSLGGLTILAGLLAA